MKRLLIAAVLCLQAASPAQADVAKAWTYHFPASYQSRGVVPDHGGGVVVHLISTALETDRILWIDGSGVLRWDSEAFTDERKVIFARPKMVLILNKKAAPNSMTAVELLDSGIQVSNKADTTYLPWPGVTDSPGESNGESGDQLFRVTEGGASRRIEKWVYTPVIVPPAVPELASTQAIGYNGANLILTWKSEAAESYQVQKSADLGAWVDVGVPITGTGADMTYSEAMTGGQSFLRVIVK